MLQRGPGTTRDPGQTAEAEVRLVTEIRGGTDLCSNG